MWQYQVVRIAPQATPELATQQLDEQARQGWEVVTVLPAPGSHGPAGHWVYLRRPRSARTVAPPSAREEDRGTDDQDELLLLGGGHADHDDDLRRSGPAERPESPGDADSHDEGATG